MRSVVTVVGLLVFGVTGCSGLGSIESAGGGGGSRHETADGSGGNVGSTVVATTSTSSSATGGAGGSVSTSTGATGGSGGGVDDAGNGTGGSGGTDDAGKGGSGGTGGSGGGAGPFRHPGVLVNKDQIAFVKGKIAANAEPWTTAFNRTKASSYGSLTYRAQPREIVECGSFNMPDNGCSDEENDAQAAYTHALLWLLTGNRANAAKAVEIMNAWSAVLKDHTNSNAPLQSGWAGAMFPRGAEIIRHTYDGWIAADVARFENMLRTVYLPKVSVGSQANGNWELSMTEATIAIGVFLDDHTVFERGLAMWRGRVPAYFYMTSDGPLPKQAPGSNKNMEALITYWQRQRTFMDGLCQETCRDLGHVQLGIAGMMNGAETARIQGVNLYGEEASRITTALEFHAKFLNGASVPSTLCGGKLNEVNLVPTWEIGYNEYANRDAIALPAVKALIGRQRPTATSHGIAWETLTHADVGAVGLP